MDQRKISRILSTVEAFKDLTESQLDFLAQHFDHRFFNPSEVIVKEGAQESSFHIILEGELEVLLPQEVEGQTKRRVSAVKLNMLKAGDCFGEYSMIDTQPASASVAALGSGELLQISTADFKRLLDQHDSIAKTFYLNILQILVQRLRMREKEYDLLFVVPG